MGRGRCLDGNASWRSGSLYGVTVIRALTPKHLVVRGRRLRTTPVYDAYWQFAAERQRIFFRHYRGDAVLTTDPILARHRFTNAYRVIDRVSQILISDVIANADSTAEDILFRVLLFKIFNKIHTWRHLESCVGPLHLKSIDWEQLDIALSDAKMLGPIYSAAYIMPSPAFGAAAKHSNHLRLLRSLLKDGVASRWQQARSLRDVFALLLEARSFGPFLAYQFAIDLNYSLVNPLSEASYVVAGPGARDGIAKCFVGAENAELEAIIMAVCESQDEEFRERGIEFAGLFGRRLQPIDCQNLFCEIDKYSRVAFPDFSGGSGRTRIKQLYQRNLTPIVKHQFPSSWQVDLTQWPVIPPAEWF